MDSIPQKQCTKCKQFFPADKYHFAKDVKQSSKLRPSCKACEGRRFTEPKPPEGFKRCSKCKNELLATLDNFVADCTHTDGLSSQCRDCKIPAKKRRIRNHPDGKKICSECGAIKERTLEYFRPDPQGQFGLRPECKECALNKQRMPERVARQKAYRQSDRWKEIDRSLPRRIAKRTKGHKRRALEMNCEGYHNKKDIFKLYIEQCGLCAYCSIELDDNFHIDHVKPLSRGGSNWPDNLALSCPRCNLSKHDLLIEEWEAVRGW